MRTFFTALIICSCFLLGCQKSNTDSTNSNVPPNNNSGSGSFNGRQEVAKLASFLNTPKIKRSYWLANQSNRDDIKNRGHWITPDGNYSYKKNTPPSTGIKVADTKWSTAENAGAIYIRPLQLQANALGIRFGGVFTEALVYESGGKLVCENVKTSYVNGDDKNKKLSEHNFTPDDAYRRWFEAVLDAFYKQ